MTEHGENGYPKYQKPHNYSGPRDPIPASGPQEQLCHCELSGFVEIITGGKGCELCEPAEREAFTPANVAKAFKWYQDALEAGRTVQANKRPIQIYYGEAPSAAGHDGGGLAWRSMDGYLVSPQPPAPASRPQWQFCIDSRPASIPRETWRAAADDAVASGYAKWHDPSGNLMWAKGGGGSLVHVPLSRAAPPTIIVANDQQLDDQQLVAKLREAGADWTARMVEWDGTIYGPGPLLNKAADRIEALNKQVAQLTADHKEDGKGKRP